MITKPCKLVITDEINCYMTGLKSALMAKLENDYKYKVQDANFSPAYKLGRWDGFIKLFNNGQYYNNLLDDDFFETVANYGYALEVEDRRRCYERDLQHVSEDHYKHIHFKGEPMTLREVQVKTINACVDSPTGMIIAATGAGKCLGRGTPVLMFDGSIKPVEEVVAGDLVMGPDSSPRRVISTTAGSEMMYRVTPVQGDPYIVNESHILSLKKTGTRKDGPAKDKIVNISVLDYVKSSSTFKHTHKGWRTGVDFQVNASPSLDPYYLGLWLGDGNSRTPTITTSDPEIHDWVIDYATKLGLLKHYNLFSNKHVPHAYKTASRSDRLQLLAGIVDSDGHYDGKTVDLVLKSERLLDDIIFMARSLGFSAYKQPCTKTCTNNGVTGTYYRCSISGHTDVIPTKVARKRIKPRKQKKDNLVTGIKVEPIGVGEYFGFTLEGPDRLFLLGDFTVTHNTVSIGAIADLYKGFGRVMVVVPSVDLVLQTLETFAVMELPSIGEFHGDRKTTENIIVGTWQSLIRYPEAIEGVTCIIADECHEYDAKEIFEFLTVTARDVPFRYGFTGTMPKEELAQQQLKAVLGEVLYTKAAHELQDEGILARCHVNIIQTQEVPGLQFADYHAEKTFLLSNPDRKAYLANLITEISKSGNTLVIIDPLELGEYFKANVPNCTFVNGAMPSKKRLEHYARFAVEDNITLVCTRGVIKRGIDIGRVFNVVLIEMGKEFTAIIQMIGRGLRRAPDKDYVDIYDLCGSTKHSKIHLRARKNFYTEARYPYNVTKVPY